MPLIQILGSYARHGFTKLEKEVVLGSDFFFIRASLNKTKKNPYSKHSISPTFLASSFDLS